MYKSFLIKYAEIGVKGKNRYIFEDRLCEQIRYALERCEGEFEVTKTQGRIYVNALTEYDFDETVEASRETTLREMEKTTNEKIMAISEFSDTIVDTMNQTHNEIMFLYSMLNDKQKDITELTGTLQRLTEQIRTGKYNQPVKKQPEKKKKHSLFGKNKKEKTSCLLFLFLMERLLELRRVRLLQHSL